MKRLNLFFCMFLCFSLLSFTCYGSENTDNDNDVPTTNEYLEDLKNLGNSINENVQDFGDGLKSVNDKISDVIFGQNEISQAVSNVQDSLIEGIQGLSDAVLGGPSPKHEGNPNYKPCPNGHYYLRYTEMFSRDGGVTFEWGRRYDLQISSLSCVPAVYYDCRDHHYEFSSYGMGTFEGINSDGSVSYSEVRDAEGGGSFYKPCSGNGWYITKVETNYPFFTRSDYNKNESFNSLGVDYTGFGIAGEIQVDDEGQPVLDDKGDLVYLVDPIDPIKDFNNPNGDNYFNTDNIYDNDLSSVFNFYGTSGILPFLNITSRLIYDLPGYLFEPNVDELEKFINSCRASYEQNNSCIVYIVGLIPRVLNGYLNLTSDLKISVGPCTLMGYKVFDKIDFDYNVIFADDNVRTFHEYYLKSTDFFLTLGMFSLIFKKYHSHFMGGGVS